MLIGISGKMGSGKNLVCTIIQGLTAAKKHNIENPSFEWIKKYYINSIWEQKAFAGKLKDMVCMLIGCTREHLEDREFKEKELGEEWRIWYMTHYKLSNNNSEGIIGKIYSSEEELLSYEDSEFFKNLKLDGYQIVSKLLTPRKLLQLLGTDCIRDKVHPNAWVNALFADYKYEIHRSEVPTRAAGFIDQHVYPNWIITDMRFPNELEAVKDRGGISIRVNRPYDSLNQDSLFSLQKQQETNNHPSETALDNAEFDYIIENNSSIEDLIHTVSLILKKEKII